MKLFEGVFTYKDGQNMVEAEMTRYVVIKPGTVFYDNNKCVQIYVDPLIGYMVISPKAWEHIQQLYELSYKADKSPFEKNNRITVIKEKPKPIQQNDTIV